MRVDWFLLTRCLLAHSRGSISGQQGAINPRQIMPKRSKLDRFYDLHANFLLATYVSRVATCKLTGWEDVRSSEFTSRPACRCLFLHSSKECEQGPKAGRDTFLDGHRLQQVLAPAIKEVCQVPDPHIPLFPRAGLVSRGAIPSWVDTIRPVPISYPPRAPDTPGTTATHPSTFSQHMDTCTHWPCDPSLVDIPTCPLRNTPVSLVEICGGIATGLEALQRAGHSIRSYAWADINPDAYLATKRRLRLLRFNTFVNHFTSRTPPEFGQ